MTTTRLVFFQILTKCLFNPNRIGNYAVELECTYNAKDPIKSKNCPRLVRNVKHVFNTKAVQLGEKPFQYVNTPSCDDFGDSFGQR